VKASQDPFETLIVTIISQNTADTNTERAYGNLQRRFPITPKALSEAQTGDIEECLRVGGLYRSKAKTIQAVSKTVLERFGGTLNAILALPTEEARKTLMEMQGVGPKTADVVLLFSAGKPTVPVDTHVFRVSKRLGLAPKDGDYEAVRQSLQALFEPKDYLSVHQLLIGLGRQVCKAQKPLCCKCPVSRYCPSNNCGGKP
jgi:endonuclease-3